MTNKSITKICSIDGCGPARRIIRGLCKKHYERQRLHGDASVVLYNLGVGETPEQRFWSRVALTADDQRCWDWQAGLNDGYGTVWLNGKQSLAHRAAWYYTTGAYPSMHLLHSCDRPVCVNPNHLREGSNQDNVDDAVRKNRHPHGVSSGRAKLTESDVIAIRGRYAGGATKGELATQFYVTRQTIGDVINRTWRHL